MPADAAAWQPLLAAITHFYRARAACQAPGHDLLARAAEALALMKAPTRPAEPAVKPVSRLLTSCIADAGPALKDIAAAIAPLAPRLEWQQNANYTAANLDPHFLAGYGYVEPVGPGRLFHCPDLRVGLLLLGPGLTYPDHAHAAEEVYHVLAGRSWWRREGEAWREAPIGTGIHHAPFIRHATRTGDAPMLALYCWGGDIGAHAALSVKEHGG